jgi:hypothetical protein
VVLEVLVPEPVLTTIDVDGEPMTRAILVGAGSWSEPGKPGVLRLPIFVGVPRGARVTAAVLQEDVRIVRDVLIAPAPRDTIESIGGLATSREIFERDLASYASPATFPLAKAAVVSTSRMRFQEYATIDLYPVRARAALREIDIVSRFVVEVRWDASAGSGGGGGSGAQKDDPGAERAAWEHAPVEDLWEPVYRGLVANPEQAAGFRERISPRSNPLAGPRKSGARQQDDTEWKIQIEESGLYRIPFETLQNRGFPSFAVASDIRIFQRSVSDSLLWQEEDPFRAVEIPLHIVDAAGDGFFGPGDAVHVYLRGFRDQFMPNDYEDMFSGSAAYWLVVTPGEAGLRMTSRDGDLGLTGTTTPERFADTLHYEPDVFFNTAAFGGPHDLWFSVDYDAPAADLGLTLTDVDTARPFRFRVQALGRTANPATDATHRLEFSMNGTPFAGFQFDGRVRVVYAPDSSFTGAILREGGNTLTYTGTRFPSSFPGSGAYVDWVEIAYQRFYRASGDRLAFTSGDATGPTEMRVSNFDGAEIYLYDVTDPLAPVRIVAAIVPAEDGNALRFQAQVDSLLRYEAATPAGARTLTDAQLIADTSGRLAESEADYVMIVYDEFEPGLAPLVEHRESEGLRVKVARLSDVYDEWSGGITSPDAIRTYMKFAFTYWEKPPTYLLLVGDAKEDHRHRRESAPLDYVPSLPVYSPPVDESQDYWDASDNWYTLLDNPPNGFVKVLASEINIGTDPAMDVLVGRLSIASLNEVTTQVTKTARYETEDLDGAWRSRYFFVADDAWITETCPFGAPPVKYCDAGHIGFEVASNTLVQELANAPLIALDTIYVRHNDATDSLRIVCDDTPDDQQCNCMTLSNRSMGNMCVINGVRNTLTPFLFETMNEGVLFTSYQGHGNRWVLSHESIILDGNNHLNMAGEDVKRFAPTNKPCVFMGYGCSISEFDRYQFDDDCLTEKMMKVANGGTIATFGSTGTEFLGPNLVLNAYVQEAFLAGGFATPPRFILGEMIALGLAKYAPGNGRSMRRYVLFGDPALRLRTLPASFTVTSDGVPVDDGDFLVGESGERPVRIVIRGATEGALDDLRISRTDTGDIDPLEYPVVGDSAVYLHTLEFGAGEPYDIVISAAAIGGGTRTVRLRVDIQADITFDGRMISEGAFVDPTAQIEITLTTPLRVAAEDIEVRLDGIEVAVDPDSIGPSSWKIVLPEQTFTNGTHEVEVNVFDLSSRVAFRVQNEFAILEVLNYPNPFNPHQDATTTFSYRLTGNAEEVSIDIYTVNGRKVREMRNLPGLAGYNPAGGSGIDTMWDARDEDGDEVANGVYLYRVRAASGGASAEAMGKLVILRNEDELPPSP